MSDYINELNDSQKEAVLSIYGPNMILAGAGSGKTRVLTYRIAHLLHNGVDAFNVLALTFTNKAAKEMRERIEKIIGLEARSLWMGTFHSVFAKILRKEHEKLGFPYNFTIYDTLDAKNLLKAIIKESGLDDKVYKPGIVYNRISAAKNNLISAQAYNKDNAILTEDKRMGKPEIGNIYKSYSLRCVKAGAMDFDDLIFKTYDLFDKFPEVLEKYQNLYKYILVDEYQDTNYAQYTIVKMLAKKFKNICVVGDDAQSIYSFRGANIENILNFQKDYKDSKSFKLEQNYRSSKNIVAAANAIISKNKDQFPKDVWTQNEEGAKIKVIKTKTDNEEGKVVADKILSIKLQDQVQNNEFAILYRTNAQSRSMEESLRKLNIPYKIYGGQSFYQRKEIKDLLAYYRMTFNPNDEEALKRVINYPTRGIGKSTIDKLILTANSQNASLWEIASNIDHYNTGIGNGPKAKIRNFATMILSFGSELHRKNAYDLGNYIASQTGLLKDVHGDKTPEGVSRYENIQELLNGLKLFSNSEEISDVPTQTLDKFMEDVALLTDADKDAENDIDRVSLMTIHSSKGLEFPHVFIVGMEENLFPSQLSVNSRTELEEERRLFYVAITRAEKSVYLSYAQTRFKFGTITYAEPSRFITEIPLDYLEMPQVRPPRNFAGTRLNQEQVNKKSRSPIPLGQRLVSLQKVARSVDSPSIPGINKEGKDIKEGQKVEHLRFGPGKVTKVEGIGPSKKAVISFENHGEKQILLKFAKLKIVG
jgi:DNA helicase-2/ATP-dependent DNA helicase PcrA|tara:strand:+ start:30548 stop:32833 length:2286 start_codon:yes stop_codon:yes gene_type:complete